MIFLQTLQYNINTSARHNGLLLHGQCVTTSWCLRGFSRPTMQGMESVVAVLIPDTSFWLKCWDIRCQWLLCIGRLVSKHRQVMLDCTPGKTGNGEDHWCSSHKLINEVNTGACLLLYGWLGLLLPWRALTWCIVQCGLALLDRVLLLRRIHLELSFPPGRTLKQCRTHQSWSMFGWLVLSGSEGFCLGSMVTWQTLWIHRTCQNRSPVHGMDALEGDLSTSQLHVVKTTCDLDKSRSPFGGCVTTLWCLCGFSRPTMQGTESVVAVLIPDTSFWLKCWDIRCQWLLCIGRLVSKHRQVMLDCMPGKTGNGEDHWCSSHNWSMRSTPEHVFCCTDDWVCFYLGERLQMVYLKAR